MRGFKLPQFGRFLSVGVLNTVVGLLVIFAMKGIFHLGDVAANAIGYSVGLLVSFTLNSRWTFSYQGAPGRAFGKFLAMALVAYGMNLLTVLVAIRGLGLNDYFSHILGIPAYTLTMYLTSKYFVFRTGLQRAKRGS